MSKMLLAVVIAVGLMAASLVTVAGSSLAYTGDETSGGITSAVFQADAYRPQQDGQRILVAECPSVTVGGVTYGYFVGEPDINRKGEARVAYFAGAPVTCTAYVADKAVAASMPGVLPPALSNVVSWQRQ